MTPLQLDRSSIWRYAQNPLHQLGPVTICVAAICQYPWFDRTAGIVAAGDLMLTSGDGLVEFERPVTKVFPIGERAAVMAAGAINHIVAICEATSRDLRHDPTDDVQEIANRLADQYQLYRQRRVEQTVLAPLGLNLRSFRRRQATLGGDVVEPILEQLWGFDLQCTAIVAGVDDKGAHLFTVGNPGTVTPHRGTGFVAIGIGTRHALSQFMLARYDSRWHLGEALLLTYTAKKKAEIAPGVGTATSLLLVTERGRIESPNTAIVNEVDAAYREIQLAEDEARTKGRRRVSQFLDSRFPQDPHPEEPPSTDSAPVAEGGDAS